MQGRSILARKMLFFRLQQPRKIFKGVCAQIIFQEVKVQVEKSTKLSTKTNFIAEIGQFTQVMVVERLFNQ